MFMQGWINNPAAVEKSVARLIEDRFTGIISGDHPIKGAFDGKTSAYAWKAEEVLFGKRLKSWNQTRGTCTSKGNGRAAQDTMLLDVAIKKDGGSWPGEQVASEPIYALSRVEIGGGQISGDGSIGAWCAQALMKFGVMFRKVYTVGGNTVDLTQENDDIAAKWGSPRSGLPDWMEPIAKEHPIQDVALVNDLDRALDVLSTWRTIAVCWNQGFAMLRSSDGSCTPTGRWDHCMEARGVIVLKNGEPKVPIQNSWADYLGGEFQVETLNDGVVTLPEGCFLASTDVFGRMLRQGDSFAFDKAKGFAPRKLVWEFV